ncbi:CaiB/BaiF CoA-transferase family protein [Halioxenophilus sp. WMMB6]|uniref:CaiB/BaiF CoA transferase family protein n=1 Tax=Halioxenophilus sp. WMMB6 TaxID=3073815 RepID=UPI00295EF005|nr:CaiB/BaiF CoA-transferase family protein [Halioxenophilus sp. WMMB6]
MSMKMRGGPLAGVRVVELTKVWAGPYTGKQLAFLGAEVMRVESLGSLDVTRFYGVDDINKAPGFRAVNPQKMSVQIDSKTERGVELLIDLIKAADIFIENLRPGAVDRMGIGYEQIKAINPNIIYVSMGMYGAEGPLAYQTGYAPCFAALSGLSAMVGYEGEAPTGMNIRYADSTFGTAAAFAASVALLHRRRTGQGQFIDVSAVEAMTSMIGDTVMDYTLNQRVGVCDGNKHPGMAPHGVYPCRDDEWVSIAVASDEKWQAFVAATGLTALANNAELATLAGRKAQEEALNSAIADWSQSQSAEEIVGCLMAAGIGVHKSLSSLDLIADANLWGRGFYQEVEDAEGNARSILGPAWKMTRPAAVVDDAPALGQHNQYVLGEILGLSEAEQAQLVADGVIR